MASVEPQKSFRLQLLKPEDLLSDRTLLLNVNALLNDVFDAQLSIPPGSDIFRDIKRIKTEDQLVRELGDDGLVALLFDDALAKDEGKYGKLVAMGCIKPWKERVLEAFLRGALVDGEKMGGSQVEARGNCTSTSNSWDWEVSSCASVDDPRYRRTGMVTRCVEALRQELIARRDKILATNGQHTNLTPIKFWISARVGVGNQEYWTRRGYELEGPPETAPVGVWGAKQEFQIATMSKVVA